jgi:hypothetical protein
MKMINESDLHLYHLNKDLLNAGVRNEIEYRLSFDQGLIDEYGEIVEFYDNYEKGGTGKEVKTYSLAPLSLESDKPTNIVLAARQSESAEPCVQHVKTFISAEKYIAVRMFRNSKSKEYEFYVLSEGNENVGNACIKIPVMNRELYTDEHGFAKISAEYMPDDIEVKVILR